MIELPPAGFHRARPLFAPLLAYQMFCAGVLNGRYAGRVWVDDAQAPRSGLVTKDNVWWFLAGDPENAEFNTTLHTAIFDRTVGGEKGWGGMLVCHPAEWDRQIPALFAPHIPITTERLHYTCRQLDVDWQAQVPEGFEVRFVDEALAADGVEVQGAAADVLALRRGDPAPDLKAVGYVAVHDGKIVASSVIDCIVNGGGDIGLYTDGEFRRRGLAYLTAAAVIEYALAHGVEAVHWDCQSFNLGSIRTAEKLGLHFSHAHTMYNLILNPVLHEVNRAWSYFDAGQYEQVLEVCQVNIAKAEALAHSHFYYLTARSYAETARPAEALAALGLAADAGWDSVEEAVADLGALAAQPGWEAVLERVKRNAAKEA